MGRLRSSSRSESRMRGFSTRSRRGSSPACRSTRRFAGRCLDPGAFHDPAPRPGPLDRAPRSASGLAPAKGDRVLGVADRDLFIPILTFVFGEAQLGGRAAVFSTARLDPASTASRRTRTCSSRAA